MNTIATNGIVRAGLAILDRTLAIVRQDIRLDHVAGLAVSTLGNCNNYNWLPVYE
jgi:hypothetical protein